LTAGYPGSSSRIELRGLQPERAPVFAGGVAIDSEDAGDYYLQLLRLTAY
jgi:hypothetical protein